MSRPLASDHRRCAWRPCGRELSLRARADALYCSKPCRQAAWRLSRELGRAERADRPLRLAYADPPYPGLSRKYYQGHPDYRGEVDHRELLQGRAGDQLDDLFPGSGGVRLAWSVWTSTPAPGDGSPEYCRDMSHEALGDTSLTAGGDLT